MFMLVLHDFSLLRVSTFLAMGRPHPVVVEEGEVQVDVVGDGRVAPRKVVEGEYGAAKNLCVDADR